MTTTTNTDVRIDAIKNWLADVLGTTDYQFEAASSDASFRRYFRVKTAECSWIVMDAPPEYEDIRPFVRIATFLYQQHVHVPQIIAQQDAQGFLLLTDFGSTAYLDVLTPDSVDLLYSQAIHSLLQIQTLNCDDLALPSYDRSLLLQELQLFPDWFLNTHLALTPPDCLSPLFELLVDNAVAQPQVMVHRDYHSRNLMHTETDSPGIIDFQDAVIGPVSYDLVSLLRDCYITWPEDTVTRLLHHYFSRAKACKLLATSITFDQFVRWFDLMGLQRHLKVLGIFCRLNYRDNKPHYLNDLPLTLRYVRQICRRYPELAEFENYLSRQPRLQQIA